MEKESFIEQFIITFLATHAAVNYEQFCINGEHDKLLNGPIEDAEDIAKGNWEKVIGIRPW